MLVIRACPVAAAAVFLLLNTPLQAQNTGGAPQQAPIMVELEKRLSEMAPPRPPFHGGLIYKQASAESVKLDLYLPFDHDAAASVRHPVYFYVHGGSWLFGDRRFVRLGQALIDALRSHGIAVVSIDYRKLSLLGFRPMVEDCLDSLQWLTKHAEQYHLDTRRVVLHGVSSGGHLALLMAFRHEVSDLEIRLVLDEFGPADLTELSQMPFRNGRHPLSLFPAAALAEFSPVSHVRRGLPPIHVIHGERDTLVPLSQSHRLHEALLTVDNQITLDVIPGGDHGLLNISARRRKQLQEFRIRLLMDAFARSSDDSSPAASQPRPQLAPAVP